MPAHDFEEAMSIQERMGKPPQRELNIYWNKAMDSIEETNYNDFAYYSIKAEQRCKREMEGSSGNSRDFHIIFNRAKFYAKQGRWSMVYETMMDIKSELEDKMIAIPAVVK